MEIVFLGTGGGRINLIKQIRATGGFRINSSSANIHVDPGPGALIQSVKNKQDPLSLDCIIVTHNHTDHVNDAQVLVEGMSHYCLKKNGIVISTSKMIEENGISPWHLEKVNEVYEVEFREKKKFSTKKGEFEIEIIKMAHDEEPNFGFIIVINGKKIGYISDTEFDESYGEAFSGCDILVVNCIKPEDDKYHGHLTSIGVAKILKVAKPEKAVITHLGMKMLRNGPTKEAEKIEEQSGVKTIAAKDGMKITV
jgi:ribonuclease BN (tRNA processing enzyme)